MLIPRFRPSLFLAAWQLHSKLLRYGMSAMKMMLRISHSDRRTRVRVMVESALASPRREESDSHCLLLLPGPRAAPYNHIPPPPLLYYCIPLLLRRTFHLYAKISQPKLCLHYGWQFRYAITVLVQSCLPCWYTISKVEMNHRHYQWTINTCVDSLISL